MSSKPALLLAASMAIVLVLQACNTGSSTDGAVPSLARPAAVEVESPIQGSEAAGGLPSPTALLDALPGINREASFEQEDLLRAAEDFSAVLPFNRVSAQADGLGFSPDWFPGDSLDGLAYALYSFQLPNYEGQAVLSYDWITEPTNPERVFVALANWDLDRWSWHSGNAEGRIELASFDPHFIGGGNMLVCFLVTGESPAVLDSIRIGSLPPQVSLSADQAAGLVPSSFLLTASATDPDGAVVEYRWDPEGDGSFEVSTGTDPSFTAEYVSPGRHRPAVRAVDNDGIFGEAELGLAVYGEVTQNFGIPGSFDEGDELLVGSDGRLLIVGNVNQQLIITGLDPGGELLFSTICSASDNILDLLPFATAMGNDGFVYIAAFTLPGPVIQKWSQDGAHIWSRHWPNGNNGLDILDSICALPDGNIVCAGSREVPVGNHKGVILCLDPSGTVIWNQEINSPANEARLNDVQCFIGDSGVELRACGTFLNDSTDTFYVAFNSAGTLLTSQIWQSDSFDDRAQSLASLPNGEAYVIGYFPAFGVDLSFVNQVGGEILLLKDEDDLDLRAIDLLPVSADRMQLILRREQEQAIVGYLDGALTLQSMEIFTSSGKYLLNEAAGLGLSGHVLVGGSEGSLPVPVVYTPDSDITLLDEWIDFAAEFNSSPLVLEEFAVTTSDATSQIVTGNDAARNHTLVVRRPPVV